MSHAEEPRFTGGCLCGAVRYVATGAPLNVRVCHCRNCQKATGSAFFVRAQFPHAAVSVEGKTEKRFSSQELARHFCPKCGTPLFAERAPDLFSIALGTLDDPAAIRPQVHIWLSSKVPWLTLSDGLPQYAEYAS